MPSAFQPAAMQAPAGREQEGARRHAAGRGRERSRVCGRQPPSAPQGHGGRRVPDLGPGRPGEGVAPPEGRRQRPQRHLALYGDRRRRQGAGGVRERLPARHAGHLWHRDHLVRRHQVRRVRGRGQPRVPPRGHVGQRPQPREPLHHELPLLRSHRLRQHARRRDELLQPELPQRVQTDAEGAGAAVRGTALGTNPPQAPQNPNKPQVKRRSRA